MRDAIQTAKVKTLQGEVSFDENGDITNRIVSVFQITKDDKYPLDDMLHQYKYVGVAPARLVSGRPFFAVIAARVGSRVPRRPA